MFTGNLTRARSTTVSVRLLREQARLIAAAAAADGQSVSQLLRKVLPDIAIQRLRRAANTEQQPEEAP